MKKKSLIQSYDQFLFDEYQTTRGVRLGPYASYAWRYDPRHLLFSLARYKFCAKMLSEKENLLEIGCGDGFGSQILLQTILKVHGIDLEPAIIEDNIQRNRHVKNLTFEQMDITKSYVSEKFDAAVSIDVIEHISKEDEHNYMNNICASLKSQGVFIIGTPNITASSYASQNSIDGHVNLKSHETLRDLTESYFHNTFMFSMNDEVVHTGFFPMAHFLIALCVNPKG